MIPETEQGLINFIKYAESEVRVLERKVKTLIKETEECRKKLDEIEKQKTKDKKTGVNQ